MLCRRQIKRKSTILKRLDAVQETVEARPAILKRLAISVRGAELKRCHAKVYHGATAASFKACVAAKKKPVEKVMRFAIASQGGLVWRLTKTQARDDGVEFLRDTMRQLNKLDKAARWAAKRETPCHSVSFQPFMACQVMTMHCRRIRRAGSAAPLRSAVASNAMSIQTTRHHAATCQTVCCYFPFLLRHGCSCIAQRSSLINTCSEKCQCTCGKPSVPSRTCNS